jgi:hypothetical protein
MATHRGFAVTTRNVENFWAKIDVRGEDECWPWIAGTDKLGYGRFKLGGKKGQAVETHLHSCQRFRDTVACAPQLQQSTMLQPKASE